MLLTFCFSCVCLPWYLFLSRFFSFSISLACLSSVLSVLSGVQCAAERTLAFYVLNYVLRILSFFLSHSISFVSGSNFMLLSLPFSPPPRLYLARLSITLKRNENVLKFLVSANVCMLVRACICVCVHVRLCIFCMCDVCIVYCDRLMMGQ